MQRLARRRQRPGLVCRRRDRVVVGSKGRREVPVEQIPTGPAALPWRRTSSSWNSSCRHVRHDPSDAYLRFIPRTEMDIAVVGCGISVTLDEKGVCTAARVALGAVAPTVLLVQAAADALIGHTLDAETLAKLDAAAQAAAKPISDKRGTIEYRTKVAGVLARRVAAIAFDRAPQGGASHARQRTERLTDHGQALTYPPPSTANRRNSSVKPSRPCWTCCAT